jgi:prepilin-type N-terminal cleavage/methylation domain-containing protein
VLRKGVTILEVLVGIAVICILLGLCLPVLSNSRRRAVDVAMLAAAQNAGRAVSSYAEAGKDVYPVAAAKPFTAALEWFRPLLQTGVLDSEAAADPEGMRQLGRVSFRMSMAMVYSPQAMMPGATVPLDEATSCAVRTADVKFPSSKGLLVQMEVSGADGVQMWCCLTGVRVVGAVAWADGSATSTAWQDLVSDPSTLPYTENSIGYPVFSTWFGVKGSDRR